MLRSDFSRRIRVRLLEGSHPEVVRNLEEGKPSDWFSHRSTPVRNDLISGKDLAAEMKTTREFLSFTLCSCNQDLFHSDPLIKQIINRKVFYVHLPIYFLHTPVIKGK